MTKVNFIRKIKALIKEYEKKAIAHEAVYKFEEILIAPNGYKDFDCIVVMGYFLPIESSEAENGYDCSMEELGFALRKLEGVKVLMECDLVYDENTGKLI